MGPPEVDPQTPSGCATSHLPVAATPYFWFTLGGPDRPGDLSRRSGFCSSLLLFLFRGPRPPTPFGRGFLDPPVTSKVSYRRSGGGTSGSGWSRWLGLLLRWLRLAPFYVYLDVLFLLLLLAGAAPYPLTLEQSREPKQGPKSRNHHRELLYTKYNVIVWLFI